MNIKIWPRQEDERGGIALMPMKKNIPDGREDWELTTCPKCKRECWLTPACKDLERKGVKLLCMECGLKEGN